MTNDSSNTPIKAEGLFAALAREKKAEASASVEKLKKNKRSGKSGDTDKLPDVYEMRTFRSDDGATIVVFDGVTVNKRSFYGEVEVNLADLGVDQPVPIRFPITGLSSSGTTAISKVLPSAFAAYKLQVTSAVQATHDEYVALRNKIIDQQKLVAAQRSADKILGAGGAPASTTAAAPSIITDV